MIALAYRDALPGPVRDELDQLTQGLTGMLYQQHTPDGTHTDITADSITLNPPSVTNGVAGSITFQDRLGNKTVFMRDDTDTVITLNSGNTLLIRRTDLSGTIFNLVKLGLLQVAAGSGNGIAMLAPSAALPTVFHDWAWMSSESSLAGPAMLFGDLTNNLSPFGVRYRSTAPKYWELMKTVGALGPTTEQVTLGSGFDSSQQGYWDAAYIKALFLGTGAGSSSSQLGQWADVAFAAGNFTAGGAQTWTVTSGEQVAYAYAFTGPTMSVNFSIAASTVGGTPNPELRIAIPSSFTVAGRSFYTAGYGVDNGTVIPMIRIEAIVGNGYISIFRGDGANWSASTTATSVRGQIEFSVS